MSLSNFCRFSWSLACGPAKRADLTPGAPFNASTTRPESSAMAGKLLWCAAFLALIMAFSTKGLPVSSAS